MRENLKITVCDLNVFLGIEVKRMPDNSLFINQKQYAEKIVKRFNLEDAHEVCTPLDPQSKLELFESDVTLSNVPYKEAIGSLMFLAMVTRPDISHSVGVLSRYTDKPKKAHWDSIKRVIRYVKGTSNYGLLYGKNNSNDDVPVLAYSDADFAGDPNTRKSTSGYIIKLGHDLITWSSRKQQTVTLSTTESEFVAACSTVQEMVWLDRLFRELVTRKLETPILYVDNQSTIKIIKNPQFHCRTKHIDIKYNFVREKYRDKFYKLKYIYTKKQQADILTKALPKESFERLRKDIGVVRIF